MISFMFKLFVFIIMFWLFIFVMTAGTTLMTSTMLSTF